MSKAWPFNCGNKDKSLQGTYVNREVYLIDLDTSDASIISDTQNNNTRKDRYGETPQEREYNPLSKIFKGN